MYADSRNRKQRMYAKALKSSLEVQSETLSWSEPGEKRKSADGGSGRLENYNKKVKSS